MPIIKSAIKRAKQNKVRSERLRPYRTNMKTMIRKIADLVKAGKKDEALALIPQVYKAIDTAAKKNIIRNKNAAKKKASVAKKVA